MLHTTRRRLALLALLAFCGPAMVLAAPATAQECSADGASDATTVPTRATVQRAATSLLAEINRVRGDRERGRLDAEPALALAARRHARDMVHRGYFSHTTPEGRSFSARIRATGYLSGVSVWALGEVLAWGTGACSTPAATVAAWMDSPSHRRVMLDRRYLEVGVGVQLGVPSSSVPADGATYAVEFGLVRG